MKYVEYGKKNTDVILLLHGGGLSWWNYREVAEMLQMDYHVILPILDGHAGSDVDFSSIEDNAVNIINFIDERFYGKVFLIGGLSLGGQILLEMLSKRRDICQYAFLESTLVVPSKITYSLMKPMIGSCYFLVHQKWFSKLQFKFLRIKQEFFEEYFRDTCQITKKNMITFMQENSMYHIKESVGDCTAEVYIFVGEKETYMMRESAEIIHDNIKGSILNILPNMHHGEFSITYGNVYANKILEIIKRK